jgi:tetratricopeptide (TPR) repeat protein
VPYWQGRVALVTGDRDRQKALELFKAAIALDPRYIAAYLAESTTFAQLGKPDDGLDALRQAEAKASDDPSLMVELGQAFLTLGKAADAEARFRAALDKKPDLALARIELGSALEAQGKPADAQKEYQAVAAKEPEYPGLAERQARLAIDLGKKDEAYALYQKALKQGVPTQPLRLATARLALELGKPAEAQALVEAVTKEDDRSAPGHIMMARAHLAQNRAEDALVEARRAASLADLPEAHFLLGRSLELLGKLDQSITEYSLARKPPVEGEASLGRARILVRMGATRDALAELTALARDPKLRGQSLLLLGDSYNDLGQRDKAKKAYEDAVKATPDLGEAGFKLGRALLDTGKRKPGVDELERALKLGGDKAPWAAEAWLLAGDAHREGKENEAAARAYTKYLELAPPESPQRAEVSRHLQGLGGN